MFAVGPAVRTTLGRTVTTIEVQIGWVGSKGRLNATLLKCLIIDLYRMDNPQPKLFFHTLPILPGIFGLRNTSVTEHFGRILRVLCTTKTPP